MLKTTIGPHLSVELNKTKHLKVKLYRPIRVRGPVHVRIAHTGMGYPVRVWDDLYAHGTKYVYGV